jgi:hypothetical protein
MPICGAHKEGGGVCQNRTSGGRCWRHKDVSSGGVVKATKPKAVKTAKAKAVKATKPKASPKGTIKFEKEGFVIGENIKNGKVVGIYFGWMIRETKTGIRVVLFGQKKENLTKYGDTTIVAVSSTNRGVGDILIKKDGTWGKYPECKFKRVSKEEFDDAWEYELE